MLPVLSPLDVALGSSAAAMSEELLYFGTARQAQGQHKALSGKPKTFIWPWNHQVLSVLGPLDVALVSSAAAVSEELLFRGALLPAIWPDWRGAALASVAFGALHNSGGRNWAFAAWATAVGAVYGAAFLVTRDIWVPAGAHALANVAAGALWHLRQRGRQEDKQSSHDPAH